MSVIKIFSIFILSFGILYGCSVKSSEKVNSIAPYKKISDTTDYKDKVKKSAEEWKALMTTEQYEVMREKGTERAYTGKYWDNHEKGIYKCAACGLELFSSDTKFDSGTGWPSFWQPISEKNVLWIKDNTHGMERDEVVCSRCESHLGHVFDDGPAPTGLRYCMNSICLDFVKGK
jgi:peptide-methionine (R)-S-oxide reductase